MQPLQPLQPLRPLAPFGPPGPPARAPGPDAPEPGAEPNLYLLDCPRCGEPRAHLFRLKANYPLCLWWVFNCGECGARVNGWEDKPVPPGYPARNEDGYGRGVGQGWA